MKNLIALIAAAVLGCTPLLGQQTNPPAANAQNAELEQHIRELEDRVIALEGKIRTMESEKAAAVSQPQPGQTGRDSTSRGKRARNGPLPSGIRFLRQRPRMRPKPDWRMKVDNCRSMAAVPPLPRRSIQISA